jgi:hypothetical protein
MAALIAARAAAGETPDGTIGRGAGLSVLEDLAFFRVRIADADEL